MGRPPKTAVRPDEVDKTLVTCSRCKESKLANQFRIRIDKRIKFKKPLHYLNNVCRECERIRGTEYHRKKKSNPEYRKKVAGWSREYHKRHREKILPRVKNYREKPQNKKNRKEYNKKNHDRIAQMHKVVAKKWSEYQRDNLTDSYCIQLIRTQTGLTRKEITPEMIQQKRLQIKLKRKMYEINKTLTHRNYGRVNSVFSGIDRDRSVPQEYAKHH